MVQRVERLDGLDGLGEIERAIATCNRRSSRPTPFGDPQFIRAYVANNEYFPNSSMHVRTYVVREGRVGDPCTDDAVIGYVVLRHKVDRVAGPLRGGRLEFAVTHDSDEPGVIAMAGREIEVTTAILRHLIDNERDWSMLDCFGQLEGSTLRTAAPGLASPRLRVREIAMDPFSTVHLAWPSLAEYFAALSKRMRSNVSRQTRRLYGSGEIELVFARGAETGSLFDAHLDLEDRSWKHRTDAALRRSCHRVAFFRTLADGNAGVEPSYVGVAHNGVLIAGLLNASFGRSTWSLDMSYDATHADLGPGQLPLLLTIAEAIRRGDESVHFLQFFAYFKERWLADSAPAATLQLIRRPSLWDARAMGGEVRDRMARRPATVEPILAAARQAGAPVRRDDDHSRQLLARRDRSVTMMGQCAAAELFPFTITVPTQQ